MADAPAASDADDAAAEIERLKIRWLQDRAKEMLPRSPRLGMRLCMAPGHGRVTSGVLSRVTGRRW